ncbi:hypothetical protein EF879_15995 [Micromonospora sp. HM5-17]|nr:hypothetical protein EF879_15995 [Micromonospora sp. HM5-17]
MMQDSASSAALVAVLAALHRVSGGRWRGQGIERPYRGSAPPPRATRRSRRRPDRRARRRRGPDRQGSRTISTVVVRTVLAQSTGRPANP